VICGLWNYTGLSCIVSDTSVARLMNVELYVTVNDLQQSCKSSVRQYNVYTSSVTSHVYCI